MQIMDWTCGANSIPTEEEEDLIPVESESLLKESGEVFESASTTVETSASIGSRAVLILITRRLT